MKRLFTSATKNPKRSNTLQWAIYSANLHRTNPDDKNKETVNPSAFSRHYDNGVACYYSNEWDNKFNSVRLWWCKHLDPQSPINEVGVGIHYSGEVSIMVIPRIGKTEVVKSAFAQANIPTQSELTRLDVTMKDTRRKFLTMVPATETERANPFLTVVHSLVPFDRTMQQFIRHVLAYAATDVDYQQYRQTEAGDVDLPDCRDKFKFPALPYFHYNVCANDKMGSHALTHKRYEHDLYGHFPEGRTKLTQAICDNDMDAVRQIVTEDPNSVLRTDAYGAVPITLAQFRSWEMFQLIHDTATHKAQTNCQVTRALFKTLNMFNTDEQARERFDEHKPPFDVVWRTIERSGYKPARPALHQACVAGDITTVRRLLDDAFPDNVGDLLYASDPWALTPLVIAAGEGHAELLELLLQYREKYCPVFDETKWSSTEHMWGLCQNAKNNACLKVLLRYSTDPNELTTVVHECVERDELDKMKLFYSFGRDEIQNETGLTPLDMAIVRASKSDDTSLLEWLLARRTQSVIAAPYDEKISVKVAHLLTEHNKRIAKSEEKKSGRPKARAIDLLPDENNPSELQTCFEFGDNIIISSLKCSADLTDDEVEQIHQLFDETFACRVGDTAEARRDFFNHTFPRKREESVFIELCKIGNRVISFSSFTIINSRHDSCGEFQLFYGKLAGITPEFEALGLANFIFRIPLGLKMLDPDKPLFVYYKAIRPGFSWQLIPSVDCHVYPKYYENEDLVRHVVNLTGEDLSGPGLIDAILRVNREAPRTDAIDEFAEMAGPDARNALPVFWVVTNQSTQAYIDKLQYNSVTQYTIAFTTDKWQRLFNKHLAQLATSAKSTNMNPGLGHHYAALNSHTGAVTSTNATADTTSLPIPPSKKVTGPKL